MNFLKVVHFTNNSSAIPSQRSLIPVCGLSIIKTLGALLTASQFLIAPATAQTHRLVKDINASVLDRASSPRSFMRGSTTTYFSATTPEHGRELWKTDGTSAGTVLVKDINFGSRDSNPRVEEGVLVNNVLLFLATTPSHGLELWRSDGTQAGTFLVKDIRPGPQSGATLTGVGAYDFARIGTVVYFAAEDGSSGVELWRSDGTEAGTLRVADIASGSSSSTPTFPVAIGSTLFFQATTSTHGAELWKSDGTAAGTTLVRDIRSGTIGSQISQLTVFNGRVYFSAIDGVNVGQNLWSSDGTTAGTFMVREIDSNTSSQSPIYDLTATSSQLFFIAQTAAAGQELWRSDGTTAGTYLVADLRSGTSFGVPHSSTALTPLGGSVIFVGSAQSGSSSVQNGLWISTGASGSATYLGFHGASHTGVLIDGNVFLLSGQRIVRTNGTPSGTVDFTPASLFVQWPPSAVGSKLLFAADTVSSGFSTELWTSGTSPDSATLLKDLAARTADSAARDLVGFAGKVMFHAADGVNGTELWSSDGSEAGTQLVADIRPGALGADASTIGPRILDGILHFARDDGSNGIQLWQSDGSAAGTRRLTNQAGATVRGPMGKLGNRVLYVQSNSSFGQELWVSNGTLGDEQLVMDINPGSANSFPLSVEPVELNGRIYFVATSAATGYELWGTDGTPAGTSIVAELMPGPADGLSNFLPIVRMGAHLYFAAHSLDTHTGQSRGWELWRSDGTAAGTQLVKEIGAGSSSGINPSKGSLLAGDGVVWFSAGDASTGFELWRSDGTETGTSLVKDVWPDSNSSDPLMKVVIGSRLFFSATDASAGREPWVSDGTASGTQRLRDLSPGANGSFEFALEFPQKWPSWKDKAYFAAYDGVASQLWRTDGTPTGTVLVEGTDPGRSYNPGNLTVTQGRLFFTASDAKFGTELHVLDLPVFGPSIAVEQPSGNPLSSLSSIVDFGSINVGSSSAPKEFVVRNNGDLPLTITSLMPQNGMTWEFPAGSPLSSTVQPGETTTFTVTFSPTGSGYRWTVLRMQTNDPLMPSFDLSLGGTGVEHLPALAVEYPDGHVLANGLGMIDLGPTLLSNPMSGGYFPSHRTFRVRNLGAAPLSVNASMTSGSPSQFFHVSSNEDPSQPVAPGASRTFTVQFTPTQSLSFFGSSIRIDSNDPASNPFYINVTGSVVSPENLSSALASAGLSGEAALPTAQPFGDGVENLLKYAFNMNLGGPDARKLTPGTGTAGLPAIGTEIRGGQSYFRIEFLRRRGVALSYTPEAGPSLNSLQPMNGTETVTAIDLFWERVVIEQPIDPVTQPSRFARVRVSTL